MKKPNRAAVPRLNRLRRSPSRRRRHHRRNSSFSGSAFRRSRYEDSSEPRLRLVLLALGLGLAGTGILAGALYLAG